MNADLTTALQFHQARRYADAARCYHEILTREPENAEALNLFGVMHHQCGHSSRAVELISRAAAVRPDTAAFHANLAEAYRGLGEHERAIESCRTALRSGPLSRGGQQPGLSPARSGTTRRGRASCFARPSMPEPTSPWPGTTSAPCCGNWAERMRRSRHFVWPSLLIRPSPWPVPTWARRSSRRAGPRRLWNIVRRPCGCNPIWRPLTTISGMPTVIWSNGLLLAALMLKPSPVPRSG